MQDVFPALPVELVELRTGVDEAVLVSGPCFGLVSLRLEFDRGSLGEDRGGAAMLGMGLLERGTKRRDREGLRRALDALGARFGVWVGRTSAGLAVRVLEEVLEETLELLAEILLESADEADELADLVAETDEEMEAALVEPGAVAGRLLPMSLWPASPWGESPEGTRASRSGLTVAEAVAGREAILGGALRVGLAADEPGRLLGRVEELVVRLRAGVPRVGDGEPTGRPAVMTGKVLAARVPESAQGAVLAAARVPGLREGSMEAIELHNAMFGGGFSSPLVQRIRAKEGLSYGVGTSVVPDVENGLVVFSAQPEGVQVARTLALLRECWDGFVEGGVDGDLLELTRRMLLGQARVRLETTRARMGAAMAVRSLGLEVSELWEGPRRLAVVPLGEVEAAARRYGFGEMPSVAAALPEGVDDAGWVAELGDVAREPVDRQVAFRGAGRRA